MPSPGYSPTAPGSRRQPRLRNTTADRRPSPCAPAGNASGPSRAPANGSQHLKARLRLNSYLDPVPFRRESYWIPCPENLGHLTARPSQCCWPSSSSRSSRPSVHGVLACVPGCRPGSSPRMWSRCVPRVKTRWRRRPRASVFRQARAASSRSRSSCQPRDPPACPVILPARRALCDGACRRDWGRQREGRLRRRAGEYPPGPDPESG